MQTKTNDTSEGNGVIQIWMARFCAGDTCNRFKTAVLEAFFFKELDSVHRVCSSRSFREIHHFKNMQLFFTCNQNTWEKLKSLKKLQGIKVTPDIAQVNVVACEFHVMCIKMSLQCCQSRTDTDRVKGSRASNVRRHGWKSKNELQCLLF